MIVAVWVLAGAITSPPLLGCFPRATNRDSKKCSYNMDSSYVIFSAMGSFFLPMLVMLYVYGRISCVIASRHRNLEATESENTRPRRNVLVRIYLQIHYFYYVHPRQIKLPPLKNDIKSGVIFLSTKKILKPVNVD